MSHSDTMCKVETEKVHVPTWYLYLFAFIELCGPQCFEGLYKYPPRLSFAFIPYDLFL